MSRGRKPKLNDSNFNWKQIFSKNVGKYLQYIVIELGKEDGNKTDTSVDLIKKIKAEKAKIKKEKELPPLKKEEIPYEIPKNWVWCRLGEMSINCDGARIPVSQSEREQKEKIYDYYGASGIIDKIDGYTHNGKYLLIGEDGANLVAKSTPIAFIAEGKFWVNNHAHVLSFIDDITMNFMVYCLNSININPFITGGFQPKLSQGNLNMIPIPLPPLSEQSQIVDFLTDFENENLKEDGYYFNREVEQKVIELHESQLKGFEISTELTHQLTLVKKLRQQLLQDAVQGKLVEQNATDEPASDLLRKIKDEKQKLIAEKKLKKEKELPPIKPEEIPFEIPENWVWCRLGEICDTRLGKMLDGTKNKGEYYPYFRNLNVQWYRFELDDVLQMKFEESELEEYSVKKGDLLICEGGYPGRGAIWESEDETFKFQKALHRVRFYSKIPAKLYLSYLDLICSNGKIKDYLTGSGIQHLTGISLKKMPIPLPTLSEQNRIVQKLDELMQYCNELEASIKQSESQNEKLLQQVLREALRKEPVGV